MQYISDVFVVLKTADFERLRNHPAIQNPGFVTFGSCKGAGYAMILIHEAKWYGVWETEARKDFAEPDFVLEQQDFADELKKLDFFNFVRKGELVEDTEEHYSGSGRLVWVDFVKSCGEDKPMPLVMTDESVFDIPEPD